MKKTLAALALLAGIAGVGCYEVTGSDQARFVRANRLTGEACVFRAGSKGPELLGCGAAPEWSKTIASLAAR